MCLAVCAHGSYKIISLIFFVLYFMGTRGGSRGPSVLPYSGPCLWGLMRED